MLVGNWIVGSLGVGLGYHRLLTHRSFKAPKWLEYTLTIFGGMAIQDDAPKWVATHRIHHQFTEEDGDPHSTRPGFWWAHVGWIVRGTANDHDQETLKKYVPDLMKDKFSYDFSAILFYSAGCFGHNFIFARRLGNGFMGRFCAGRFSAGIRRGWLIRRRIILDRGVLKLRTIQPIIGQSRF